MERDIFGRGYHPSDLAAKWQSVVDELGNMQPVANTESLQLQTETEKDPEPIDVSSQGDDTARFEQYQNERANRLEVENQERMRQSELEMAEFQRKLEMSPAAYWKELIDGYAKEGVNIGLMPDVRGMREFAREYFAENFDGDQGERVDIAIKTELGKMAQAKAEEVLRMRNEGRGLPITFESEWIEAGEKDLGRLLGAYYGGEGKLGEQVRDNAELTEDEKVAWQMATLPQAPGTLNPIWVFQKNQGKLDGETTAEYYNRLKNYRRQDQMRDWQVQRDQQREAVTEEVAEQPQRRPGELPVAKAYDLGDGSLGVEDIKSGEWKAFVEPQKSEEELAKEQWERNPEEVAEAIRLTDLEIAERQEEARLRQMVEHVVKDSRVRRVLRALTAPARAFIYWMKLENFVDDDDEEVEFYDDEEEIEGAEEAKTEVKARQAVSSGIDKEEKRQKGFDPELWRATDRSGLAPIFEEGENAVNEVGAEREVDDGVMKIDVAKLTSTKVAELVILKERTEKILQREAREGFGSGNRELLQRNYDAITEALAMYQARMALEGKTDNGDSEEEAREFQDEREREEYLKGIEGKSAFESLVAEGVFSGEMGRKGVAELTNLKDETGKQLIAAVLDEEDADLREQLQARLVDIKHAIDWAKNNMSAKIIQFRPRESGASKNGTDTSVQRQN